MPAPKSKKQLSPACPKYAGIDFGPKSPRPGAGHCRLVLCSPGAVLRKPPVASIVCPGQTCLDLAPATHDEYCRRSLTIPRSQLAPLQSQAAPSASAMTAVTTQLAKLGRGLVDYLSVSLRNARTQVALADEARHSLYQILRGDLLQSRETRQRSVGGLPQRVGWNVRRMAFIEIDAIGKQSCSHARRRHRVLYVSVGVTANKLGTTNRAIVGKTAARTSSPIRPPETCFILAGCLPSAARRCCATQRVPVLTSAGDVPWGGRVA